MGRKLGDYIHLTWQGYMTSGIESHKDRNPIGPTAAIFEAHKENIRKAAQGLAIKNIQQLEKDYNKKVENNLKMINSAINSMSEAQQYDWFKQIALAAKFSQVEADMIAKDMQMDERYGVIYKPQNPMSNPLREGRITVPFFETKENTKYHQVQTVINRIEKASKKIDTLDRIEENIKNEIKKELLKICDNIKNYKDNSDEWKNTQKQFKLNTSMPIISHEMANKFIADARKILIKISAIDSINQQLAQYWAEIEGDIIAKKASLLGFWYVQDTVGSIANKTRKVAGSQTSKISVDIDMITSGKVFEQNIKELESLISKEEGTQRKSLIIDIDGKQIPVHYSLFRDYSVQQKADIIYNFNDNGNNHRMDISMKSTDLSKTKYWDSTNDQSQLSFIGLQSSTSLLLYLAGIEKMTSGLGTHYLNILAEHNDNEFGTLRYSALESLEISLLYSALTGNLQNRIGGFNANVLAIRDKALAPGVNRVKFFDMSNIIEKVIQKGSADNIVFSPSLATIRLKNDKYIAEEGEKNAVRKAAHRRAAQVLIEARTQVVSVAITKQFLNNIILT